MAVDPADAWDEPVRSPLFDALAKADDALIERDMLRARVSELEIENADLQIRNDGLADENTELCSQIKALTRPGRGWGQ